eukprot:m.119200 g.119200  ORF g.119200 m.119200 type:complete len:58 (+) comp16459_c0_seq2:207-380(+)
MVELVVLVSFCSCCCYSVVLLLMLLVAAVALDLIIRVVAIIRNVAIILGGVTAFRCC